MDVNENVYLTALSAGISPTYTSLGSGDNPIGANYTAATGDVSFVFSPANPSSVLGDILVIETAATNFIPTVVDYQDGGQSHGNAFRPIQPTPEPALTSLLLISLFGVGLFVARRFGVLPS